MVLPTLRFQRPPLVSSSSHTLLSSVGYGSLAALLVFHLYDLHICKDATRESERFFAKRVMRRARKSDRLSSVLCWNLFVPGRTRGVYSGGI